MQPVSQREYARRRGVRHSAVQRAISEGRITTLPDGRIDPAMADRQWSENTITPEGDGGKLLRARTVYMVSKARLADMQLKRLSGELLPAAEVKIAAFNASRRIRDACMNIPTRCCGAVAAEIRRAIEEMGMPGEMATRLNLAAVETILSGEIRTVLSMLSDSFEKESVDENETEQERMNRSCGRHRTCPSGASGSANWKERRLARSRPLWKSERLGARPQGRHWSSGQMRRRQPNSRQRSAKRNEGWIRSAVGSNWPVRKLRRLEDEERRQRVEQQQARRAAVAANIGQHAAAVDRIFEQAAEHLQAVEGLLNEYRLAGGAFHRSLKGCTTRAALATGMRPYIETAFVGGHEHLRPLAEQLAALGTMPGADERLAEHAQGA